VFKLVSHSSQGSFLCRPVQSRVVKDLKRAAFELEMGCIGCVDRALDFSQPVSQAFWDELCGLLRIEDERIGELFSPFAFSKSTLIDYKELTRNMVDYFYEKSFKYALSTCKKDDQKVLFFFEKLLGFEDIKQDMVYGDFGGVWKLLRIGPEAKEVINNKFLRRREQKKVVQ